MNETWELTERDGLRIWEGDYRNEHKGAHFIGMMTPAEVKEWWDEFWWYEAPRDIIDRDKRR